MIHYSADDFSAADPPPTAPPSTDVTPAASVEEPVPLHDDQVLSTLQQGSIEEQGQLPYSSNYSFLVTVEKAGLALPAVYKPRQGENPLWDFERGTLCLREVAAYVVSAALGWQLVPPTVLRDGKYGIGSVQFFIDHDDSEHYFTFQEDARYTSALRKLALFDFVINNADRKSGHCLAGSDEQLWAIDHGICFHTEYKLRTVIWEFAEEEIEAPLLHDLEELVQELADQKSPLTEQLHQLLTPDEYAAHLDRIRRLLTSKKYPKPTPYQRNYPWPPV